MKNRNHWITHYRDGNQIYHARELHKAFVLSHKAKRHGPCGLTDWKIGELYANVVYTLDTIYLYTRPRYEMEYKNKYKYHVATIDKRCDGNDSCFIHLYNGMTLDNLIKLTK